MSVQAIIIRPRFLLPLIVFLVIAGFFVAGLKLDSTLVPSPLIDRNAPSFELPLLHHDKVSFNPEDMKGQVWLLNVWASWCIACRDEHGILVDLFSQGVPIIGLNYKDESVNARQWLRDWGNPYLVTAVDVDGEAAIDWGVYGVPETFVIDQAGVIRYKHIGPLTPDTVVDKILPIFQQSQG